MFRRSKICNLKETEKRLTIESDNIYLIKFEHMCIVVNSLKKKYNDFKIEETEIFYQKDDEQI